MLPNGCGAQLHSYSGLVFSLRTAPPELTLTAELELEQKYTRVAIASVGTEPSSLLVRLDRLNSFSEVFFSSRAHVLFTNCSTVQRSRALGEISKSF